MTTYTHKNAFVEIDIEAIKSTIEECGDEIALDGTSDFAGKHRDAFWDAYLANDAIEMNRLVRLVIEAELVPAALEYMERRDAA